MSVYFHSSFNLDRERMSGVLNFRITRPELDDEQIASKFGFKAPFTKRYRAWLKKCGIIKNSIKFELTDFGKVIYKKDPKLQKKPTIWYIHNYLVSSEDNAESWHYFYNVFLPKNKSFSKLELSNALSMKLMAHNPNHFSKNAPMIKVITKVLIDSYLSERALGPLNFIEMSEGILVRKAPKRLDNWNNIDAFEKLYLRF